MVFEPEPELDVTPVVDTLEVLVLFCVKVGEVVDPEPVVVGLAVN